MIAVPLLSAVLVAVLLQHHQLLWTETYSISSFLFHEATTRESRSDSDGSTLSRDKQKCDWGWAESHENPLTTVGFRHCQGVTTSGGENGGGPFLEDFIPIGTPGTTILSSRRTSLTPKTSIGRQESEESEGGEDELHGEEDTQLAEFAGREGDHREDATHAGGNNEDFLELCRRDAYFATFYDIKTKTPAWAAYRVDYWPRRLSRKSTAARWAFDNVLPPQDQTALDTGCYRTTDNERLWDRGHIVPSHAMSTSNDKAASTFLATNSAPQVSTLNSQGNWNIRESQVVAWTSNHKKPLYVVTGTHYNNRNKPNTVGAHGVERLKLNSPDYYWNAVCDGTHSLAWWGRNDVHSDHVDLWALHTVDELTDKFDVIPFNRSESSCNTHKRAPWADEFPTRRGAAFVNADSADARQHGLSAKNKRRK